MARPQKDSVVLNIRLERSISDLLTEYCEATGQSKTTAVERILSSAIKEYFEQPEGQRIPK